MLGASPILDNILAGDAIRPGAGLLELCIVVEELAKVCTTTALMPVMSNIAGVMLLRFGSDQQKATLLPRLARGEVRFSNALTEADAGSDAASIRSKAATTSDGYEISGAKSYITGTTLSDVFIVFAKHADGAAEMVRIGGERLELSLIHI